jgi:ABC-2 type transport system ATP-binding protein
LKAFIAMSGPIIRVEDLRKKYGSSEAVRGISFQVHPGDFFGLLGPNGAGKTTIIGTLTGWIAPTGGRIEILGMDLSSRSKEAKKKMGLVPQGFAFYPTLTARENLGFFGKLYGLKGRHLEERVTYVLGIVSLEDRAEQAAGTFSNGMKRRLNIAIGLLHEPALLILDEPTDGVDLQSRNKILETIKRLNLDGVTILYTTHYIEEAEDLCNRVAILDLGKIIALDTPRGLTQSFGKGIIQIELNAAMDESLLRQMETIGSVLWMDEKKRRVHLETDQTASALSQLLEWKEKRKAIFKSLDMMEPTLKTVLIRLIGRSLRD